MRIPTPYEFLTIVQGENKTAKQFKLGTVDSIDASGRPSIMFDGETEPSQRRYPRLSNYTPVEGDRVLLAVVGSGYVVLDKIV